jgi:hypothetical protein
MLKTQTQSSITTFAECQEKYRLAYREGGFGIKPAVEPHYFTFGTIGHMVYRMLYEGHTPATVAKEIDTRIQQLLVNSRLSAEAINELQITKGALTGIAYAYHERYRKEILRKGKLIFHTHELKFEMPLKLETGRYVLAGEMDMLATGKSGTTYLIEDKFVGQLSRDIITDYMMSPQTVMYLIAYCELYAKPTDKVGILYRITRKPSIRQRQHETLTEYANRVRSDYLTRPEFYFYRALVKKTAVEILKYKHEIINSIHQMEMAEKYGWWLKNRRACNAKSRCQFFDVCAFGQNDGVMAQFINKKAAHTELVLKRREFESNSL